MPATPNKVSPVLAVAALLVATAAEAHHPTGGMTPTTFWHGLLSGIGHPVIGPDHLAFIVGIGLLAAITGLGLALPGLFIVAMAAGLLLHMLGLQIPYAEALLAVSVVAIGLAVARRDGSGRHWRGGGLFALAGVLHGFAFAETVIGAEPTPIVAYVVGLAATQFSLAAAAYVLARRTPQGEPLLARSVVRTLGLAIAALGTVLLVLNGGILA